MAAHGLLDLDLDFSEKSPATFKKNQISKTTPERQSYPPPRPVDIVSELEHDKRNAEKAEDSYSAAA
jgi:hypothetical protein